MWLGCIKKYFFRIAPSIYQFSITCYIIHTSQWLHVVTVIFILNFSFLFSDYTETDREKLKDLI